MHKFTDTQGRDWNIGVNVGTVRRVKSATGIDLLTLMDIPEDGQSPLDKLASDPVQIVDVLAALCEPQLNERNLDATAFAEAFNGDTLDSATNALIEEVIDFFPQPRRDYLRAIKNATDKAAAAKDKALQDAVKDGVFDKAVDEMLGKPSTDSPES